MQYEKKHLKTYHGCYPWSIALNKIGNKGWHINCLMNFHEKNIPLTDKTKNYINKCKDSWYMFTS